MKGPTEMNITFTTPLAGLDPLRNYTLHPVTGTEGVFALESVDRPEIRFHLLDTTVHTPKYKPVLPDTHSNNAVFVIVTAKPGRDGLSVNLLAPIVINIDTLTGEQIILADADIYPIDALLAAINS